MQISPVVAAADDVAGARTTTTPTAHGARSQTPGLPCERAKDAAGAWAKPKARTVPVDAGTRNAGRCFE